MVKDQSTEERILEAAKKVFFDKGLAGGRMQDIADSAGINKAMLHYYFRSKDKLFEKIFSEAFENFFPKLTNILESKDDVLTKIENVCREYMDQMEAMPYLPIFILTEVNRQPDGFLKKIWNNRKPPIKSFIDMVNKAVAEGKIQAVHPLQLLLNIVSLCIFPHMAKPLLQHVAGINKKQFEMLMTDRKKMVPKLIIQSLKK